MAANLFHFPPARSLLEADCWPEHLDQTLIRQISDIHRRCCVECHQPDQISRLDWVDFRRPERSLFLIAPPAKQWGGSQRRAAVIYSDTTDPDYCLVRALLREAASQLQSRPRRDLPGLTDPAADLRPADSRPTRSAHSDALSPLRPRHSPISGKLPDSTPLAESTLADPE